MRVPLWGCGMSAIGPVRAAATTRDNWETPRALFAPLNNEFNFTLDAAATAENAKCDRFLTGPCHACDAAAGVQQRAFCHCGHCGSYDGETVFVNPPFGPGLARWAEVWAEKSRRARAIVAVLPANTDTAWFAHVYLHASELRFLTGRVNFVGSTSGNTGGTIIAIYRPLPPGLSRQPLVALWDWRDK